MNTRTAFPLKKGTKNPVNANFDIILNECQLKMKDMINKKNELITNTNILLGKKEKLYTIIEQLDKDIINKQKDLQTKKEELNIKNEEVKQLEMNKQNLIKKANDKEADFKAGINQINFDKVQIQYGILPEKSKYFAVIKAKSEELTATKKEYDLLSEQLYMLGNELRRLESEMSSSEENERITKKKAEQGMRIIDDIYNYQAKRADELRKYTEEYEGEEEEEEEVKEEEKGKIKEIKEIEVDNEVAINNEKDKVKETVNSNVNAEKETEVPKQTNECDVNVNTNTNNNVGGVNTNTLEMLDDKIQHSEEGQGEGQQQQQTS